MASACSGLVLARGCAASRSRDATASRARRAGLDSDERSGADCASLLRSRSSSRRSASAPSRWWTRASSTRFFVFAAADGGGRGGRGGGRGGRGGGSGSSSSSAGHGSRPNVARARRKRAPPPPPPTDSAVRPAATRIRVGVKQSTASRSERPVEEDQAFGPSATLSAAARRDPKVAAEERAKLWARLGAKTNANKRSSSGSSGFKHLLEDARGAPDAASDDATKRGSGRSGTRQRGESRNVLRVGYAAHRVKYAKALRVELEEEMTRAKERLVTWDNDRLRREGYALFGLSAMREGVLQRDVVVRLLVPRGGGDGNGGRGGPPLGAELPFHRFAQGDVVSLVEGSEHDVAGANSVQGVVVERAMHFLKIAIDEEDELKVLNASKIRVDLSANTISHDRALAALVAFSEAGGMPDFAKTTAGTRLSTTGYAPLQRALIGIPDGGGDLESIASPPPPWGAKNATPGGLKPLLASKTSVGSLNPSQRAAVNAALSRTLTTWQGPPGTGKTRTLMAFIESVVAVAAARGVLKRGGGDDGKAGGGPVVLACAASNVAVDNIVEGLVRPPGGGKGSGGMRVVRLGSPAKVQPWLLATTLGAQAALTTPGKKAAALRLAARGDLSSRGTAARRQAFALEKAASALVLSRADVVCATCVGAGDDLLEGFTFRVACVDEATQCTEPAALIPLTKALSGVLVGDARQLPPTVVSRDASDGGLGVSLFERLERLGMRPMLLDRQYRMHPDLATFPSGAFYGGKVASEPTAATRPSPGGVAWPASGGKAGATSPLVFVEVDGGEERRAPDGVSLYNEEEAKVAVEIVTRLLAARGASSAGGGVAPVGGPGDVGVIAPYAAQVRVLQERWAAKLRGGGSGGKNVGETPSVDDFDRFAADEGIKLTAKERAMASSSASSNQPPPSARELEIHSVDGFQGREKEVIVLCTVRANAAGKLGFVSDDRRLNVAITRAKRGLIVLGRRETLSSDETWRAWFRWVEKRGLIVRSSELLRDGE